MSLGSTPACAGTSRKNPTASAGPGRLQPPERERRLPPPDPRLRPFDGRFFSGRRGSAGRRHLPRCGACGRSSRARSGSTSSSASCPTSAAAPPSLQDAWLDFKPSSKLKVRVGKFKSPVGLERLQSATAITLRGARVPDRPRARTATWACMLHGDLAGRRRLLRGRALDGAPDGGSVDVDLNDGKDLAGRIFLSPFKKGELRPEGAGLRHRRHHGQADRARCPPTAPAGRSASSAIVTGRHRRRHAHAVLAAALVLRGALRPAGRVRAVRARGSRRPTARASTSRPRPGRPRPPSLLTGDKASFGGVRPDEALRPRRRASGAPSSWRRGSTGSSSRARASTPASSIPRGRPREIFAWAVGAQLVAHAEREAGRRLRARLLQGRGAPAAPTARPRTSSSSARRFPSEPRSHDHVHARSSSSRSVAARGASWPRPRAPRSC